MLLILALAHLQWKAQQVAAASHRSFPSGHATMSMAGLGYLTLVILEYQPLAVSRGGTLVHTQGSHPLLPHEFLK